MVNSSSNNPVVSVVMSVYNGGAHLNASIQSILNQTMTNFEFIIINDGSTDDTETIIKSFSDNRIKLINQKNKGLVFSLNKGIKLARGKYIARQDADDLSLPSRLEKELNYLVSNPECGLVGTFFSYINEQKNKHNEIIVSPTRNLDLQRAMYVSNPFAHGSVMFRKTAWSQAGGYKNTYGPTEDFELWRRIASKWELVQIPEVLYKYRINPLGISNQNQVQQQTFTAKIIKEQWSKTFITKGFYDIINDGKYYKSLTNNNGHKIFQVYIQHQIYIARELLHRLRFILGFKTSIAVFVLSTKASLVLIRPIIGSLLRKLRIRESTFTQ